MERAVAVEVLRPYVIEVTFRDGTRRQVDLEPDLGGAVFAPLRDPALFAQVAVDPVGGSVYWPTGADLAPEFLFYGEEGPEPGFYEPGAAIEERDLTSAKRR
jgi:Protein of unknown function (DUF2442)